MSKVQLPGSVRFDSQIKMHTGTENKDVSLAKEFKDHLEGEHRQNGAIDQGKSRKIFMKKKWTERKYHVQDNASMELKDVKMYCNKKSIPNINLLWSTFQTSWCKGGSASIVICVLIQKLVWVNVQFSVYHVHVLLVHQCWTNRGYLV